MQILMALEYLNEKRLVHRLLGGNNVYMNYQGDLKLGSFGKAKRLETTMQKAHTIVGEPCAMSPEMIEGKDYDAKSDIWSLGCLVYEMATYEVNII
jgi:serine/threonine protein kinase